MPSQPYQAPNIDIMGPNGPLNAPTRDQQVLQYIQDTLGEYKGLQPFQTTNADTFGPGRQTQLSALGRFGSLAQNGGWDPQAREMQRQSMARGNEASAGQQGAALQQAQMHGTNTGGGLGAVAAQSANQGGVNAQAGAQSAANAAAHQRMLESLGAYGGLAGQVRGQDVGSMEQGFQNQLQKFGGLSNTRNSLANYQTNQLNASQAQSQMLPQALIGGAQMGLNTYGAMRNNSGGLYDINGGVGLPSTNYQTNFWDTWDPNRYGGYGG